MREIDTVGKNPYQTVSDIHSGRKSVPSSVDGMKPLKYGQMKKEGGTIVTMTENEVLYHYESIGMLRDSHEFNKDSETKGKSRLQSAKCRQ